jgi:hypothetical protein
MAKPPDCSQLFWYLAGGWIFDIYSWFLTGSLFRPKCSIRPPLHKEDTAGKDEASVDGVPHPLSLSGKDNCIVDTSSSSLSLAGMDDEKEIHARGPAQRALLDEYQLSLTQAQSGDIYGKVREEYPDANSKELAKILRAVMLTAALEARRKKIQDEEVSSFKPPVSASSASKAGISAADSRNKDGSLSMLSLGAFKPASPLSL